MDKIKGRIVKALSGFYYVEVGSDIIECRARGVMRKNGVTPLVGDEVYITVSEGIGAVDEISERKNSLLRPPVANLDRLYILSSYSNPAPNTQILDKQISICERAGIQPVVVFNKCDEGSFDEFAEIYKNAGYDTYVISCKTGEGIEDFRSSLPEGICAFTGNSGVGKSTLLNTLMPELELKTGEVSDKLGRGRHTTRHVELFDLGNGCKVADTPGFSTIECDRVPKEEVAELFKEFREYLGGCRFTSCSHTSEKGCAVLEAVRQGKIAPSRHESYCEQYRQAAALPSWERRSK